MKKLLSLMLGLSLALAVSAFAADDKKPPVQKEEAGQTAPKPKPKKAKPAKPETDKKTEAPK